MFSETHIFHSRYFTEDVVHPKIQVMPVLRHKKMCSHEQKTTYKQKSCWYCLQISIWTEDLDSQLIKSKPATEQNPALGFWYAHACVLSKRRGLSILVHQQKYNDSAFRMGLWEKTHASGAASKEPAGA